LLNLLGKKCGSPNYNDEGMNIFTLSSEETVKRLYNIVCQMTKYGSVKTNIHSNTRHAINVALRLYTLHALSKYNLENALMLIRCMKYMNMQKERTFKQVVEYILVQHRGDGRFGYHEGLVSKLKKTNTAFDDTNDLYLPLSVSAIWTLTEIYNPKFSLINSIIL
jgi:hypothetical protein